jgi:hypothetical protein
MGCHYRLVLIGSGIVAAVAAAVDDDTFDLLDQMQHY